MTNQTLVLPMFTRPVETKEVIRIIRETEGIRESTYLLIANLLDRTLSTSDLISPENLASWLTAVTSPETPIHATHEEILLICQALTDRLSAVPLPDPKQLPN